MDVLTCFVTRRRLEALVDGELAGRQEQQAAAHVGGCARCRREAEELRRLRAMLRRSLAVSAPTDWTGFWPGIVRSLEDRRQPVLDGAPAGRHPLLVRPRLALGGAAAALVVVSVTIWQLSGGDPSPPESAVDVRSANTEVPGISLMVYSPPERDVAVIWMLGPEEEDR